MSTVTDLYKNLFQMPHDKDSRIAAIEKALNDSKLEWKRLAFLLEALLACYRIGKQPSDKLLDDISRLKKDLMI